MYARAYYLLLSSPQCCLLSKTSQSLTVAILRKCQVVVHLSQYYKAGQHYPTAKLLHSLENHLPESKKTAPPHYERIVAVG